MHRFEVIDYHSRIDLPCQEINKGVVLEAGYLLRLLLRPNPSGFEEIGRLKNALTFDLIVIQTYTFPFSNRGGQHKSGPKRGPSRVGDLATRLA